MLSVSYDSSFLPRLQLFPLGKSVSTLKAFHANVLSPSNKNLSPLKKLWLKLHHRLGHPLFALVQQLATNGYFDSKAQGLSQLHLTDAPMCESCKHGKQTRKPNGATVTSKTPAVVGSIKAGITQPGQRIYSDQITSVH